MSSLKGSITWGGWTTLARVGGEVVAPESKYFFTVR